MNKRIIYPNVDTIAVIVPALECGLIIEEIAAKDVRSAAPTGPTEKTANYVRLVSGDTGTDSLLDIADANVQIFC